MERRPFHSVKTSLTVKFKGRSAAFETLRLYFRGNLAAEVDLRNVSFASFFCGNQFAGTGMIQAARKPNTRKAAGKLKKHHVLPVCASQC